MHGDPNMYISIVPLLVLFSFILFLYKCIAEVREPRNFFIVMSAGGEK